MKTITKFIYFGFAALALACFTLSPTARAVVPAPDGGYPNFNTAEGQNALFSLTTGQWNTALGAFTLWKNTEGSNNTAVGTAALLLNIGDPSGNGTGNTAVGAAALLLNTSGTQNTAVGVDALGLNTTGASNAAVGPFALYNNIDGDHNIAIGESALYSNTTGGGNTAIGGFALTSETTAELNTAIGWQALGPNTTGALNTAIGSQTLLNNNTGSENVAVGWGAGVNVLAASNVIAIGANVGAEDVSDTCYIGNIFGITSAGATTVYVNSLGKLGTIVSSRRFKDEIKPMDKASEAILALTPVTFRYKQEIDPSRSPQFGLVAEDVEKVSPALVVRDAEGKVNTVRYEAVNAMLLNEFLKEHRKVEEQGTTIIQQRKDFEAAITRQQKQIEALAAGLQRVSAQLEASKPAPQVVRNID